jgi:hypothetical protein
MVLGVICLISMVIVLLDMSHTLSHLSLLWLWLRVSTHLLDYTRRRVIQCTLLIVNLHCWLRCRLYHPSRVKQTVNVVRSHFVVDMVVLLRQSAPVCVYYLFDSLLLVFYLLNIFYSTVASSGMYINSFSWQIGLSSIEFIELISRYRLASVTLDINRRKFTVLFRLDLASLQTVQPWVS